MLQAVRGHPVLTVGIIAVAAMLIAVAAHAAAAELAIMTVMVLTVLGGIFFLYGTLKVDCLTSTEDESRAWKLWYVSIQGIPGMKTCGECNGMGAYMMVRGKKHKIHRGLIHAALYQMANTKTCRYCRGLGYVAKKDKLPQVPQVPHGS